MGRTPYFLAQFPIISVRNKLEVTRTLTTTPMKKLLHLLLLSLFLISCSNSNLGCNSDQAKTSFKDVLLESHLKQAGEYSSVYNVTQTDAEPVFNKVIKIAEVRILSQDEPSKSCKCQASLARLMKKQWQR